MRLKAFEIIYKFVDMKLTPHDDVVDDIIDDIIDDIVGGIVAWGRVPIALTWATFELPGHQNTISCIAQVQSQELWQVDTLQRMNLWQLICQMGCSRAL